VNIAEKILAAHADKKEVSTGEFLSVRVDMVLSSAKAYLNALNRLMAARNKVG